MLQTALRDFGVHFIAQTPASKNWWNISVCLAMRLFILSVCLAVRYKIQCESKQELSTQQKTFWRGKKSFYQALKENEKKKR